MLRGSKFVVYKTPITLYEHLINAIAVDMQVKRVDVRANDCLVKNFYKDLKSRKFPDDELEDLVIRAVSKVSRVKQMKIGDFFKPKEKPGSLLYPEVGLVVDPIPAPSNSNKPSVEMQTDTKEPRGEVEVLCKLLDVQEGTLLSDSIEENSNIHCMAGKTNPLLKTFIEQNGLINSRATYFQSRSDFTQLKVELEEKIGALKVKLELMVNESQVNPVLLAKMSIPEKARYYEYCRVILMDGEKQVCWDLDDLFKVLKKMNRKL